MPRKPRRTREQIHEDTAIALFYKEHGWHWPGHWTWQDYVPPKYRVIYREKATEKLGYPGAEIQEEVCDKSAITVEPTLNTSPIPQPVPLAQKMRAMIVNSNSTIK